MHFNDVSYKNSAEHLSDIADTSRYDMFSAEAFRKGFTYNKQSNLEKQSNGKTIELKIVFTATHSLLIHAYYWSTDDSGIKYPSRIVESIIRSHGDAQQLLSIIY